MKFLKIAGISTIVIIALAALGVTLAFAQKPTPTDTPWWNSMRSMMQGATGSGGTTGSGGVMGDNFQSMQQMHDQMTQNGGTTGHGGMMGGNGQSSMQDMHKQMSESGGMGAMHEWMHQSDGVHDSVWNALAAQLSLTPEELTAQINSGKTMAEIAQEKGVSAKDLAATMESGMQAGLAQAVKDGKLTQEQADLMLQHMAGQFEWMITNMGTGSGGMMGSGSGTGGCHDDQTTENITDL